MRALWAAALLSLAVPGGWGRGTPPSPSVRGAPMRVHAAGPPSGRTGGFGEPTCQECHTEYGLDEPGGAVSLEGLPAAWEAGRRYDVVVILRSEEMRRAGFQLSARLSDGTPAGTLTPVGTRVAVVDSTGVPYAQHAPGGSAPETPELARWIVSWQAPATGGRVVFNAAANSANGDDSPFGDLIYTTEVVVPGR